MSDTVLERWIEWDGETAVVCYANVDTARDVAEESRRRGWWAIARCRSWGRKHGCGELEVRRV